MMLRKINFYRPVMAMVLVALIISGCKVGPKFKSPDLDTPNAFLYDSIQTDSTININWWVLFDDPKLKELIEVALVENKDLLIAAARVEEARAILGFTKSDIYPSFGYQGNVDVTNINPVNSETGDAFKTAVGGATLSWEIDFWGKFRMASEAAQAELMATEYGKRAIQVGIISEVVRSYFVLLDNVAKLKICERTLDSRTESLRIIQERFNKGVVGEIDLNQAQIQEAIAAAAIPMYKRYVAKSEHAVSLLLGRNPAGISVDLELYDQALSPDIPAGIPSEILMRRPDLRQVENQLIAQNARIGVAHAQRFPSISLTGLLGAASTDLANFSTAWTAGGSILGPLFQFGKNKRRVEVEKARYEQVLHGYEQSVIEAFRDVEDALVEISTFKEEFTARSRRVIAAENAAHLSVERYNGGVTSYLEVLDSERQLFTAELDAASTRRDQLISYIKLYKALGGGWITQSEAQKGEE